MGEKKYICMRIQSEHSAKDGGFYHEYGGKKPTYIAPKRMVKNFQFNPDVLVQRKSQSERLAESLGVSVDSVKSLWAYRMTDGDGWLLPMRDGSNEIIGLHYRWDDGTKTAKTGSQNGLFIPQIEPQKTAYICEGASNTAALLTMSFYAIGRPSCNSGGEMLKVALKRLGVRNIVIVADNDCLKSAPDGRTFRPGQDGARKLKKELGLMSVIFTTPNPIKDVRQLLNKVGIETARAMINSSVTQKIWTRA